MVDIFEKFQELARKASFHYANDTTKEWSLGDEAKRQAIELFDNASPNLQKQMREVVRNQLWSLIDECYE
jgi:hypothetical protein